MKLKNILFTIASLFALQACYEDLGNYEYVEINQLTVEGIDTEYKRDIDDSLVIIPRLIGTQYDDPSRFEYEWEVADKIISDEHNLRIVVNMTPGTKISRFIVKDKETGVKKFHQFTITISSSTAGDLIVVLSKYQGRAEMSYLRLDKESNFAINYYKDRFGKELGRRPKQLYIEYTEASKCYPFTTSYGRLMALVDDQINLIGKESMQPDTLIPFLTGEHYTGNASYPKPDIGGYKPEYLTGGINIWRKSAYGSGYQTNNSFAQISGGALYAAMLAPIVWSPGYYYKKTSPYKDGYLTDFCYYDSMEPTPNNNLIQLGYTLGDLIVFDRVHGRFAKGSSYGSVASISTDAVKAFPGYDMIYGSATSIANTTSIAFLHNGADTRLVMLDHTGDKGAIKLAGEVSCGNVINKTTRFYTMKYNEYMFFVTDNKLYRYNLNKIMTGEGPSAKDVITDVTDFGCDANATISALYVSRSEKTMLLGISNYGSDTEAMGEEAKGDLIYLDLNATSLEIQYNVAKSHRGVAGIPVDVQVKYQTHWRDGFYIDGTLRDNI